MKTFALILLLVCSYTSSNAQPENNSTQVSNLVCSCISESLKGQHSDERAVFEKCFNKALSDLKIDIVDVDKKTTLAKDVVLNLFKNCNDYQTLLQQHTVKFKPKTHFPFDSSAYKPADCSNFLKGKFVIEKTFSITNGKDSLAYSIVKKNVWTDYSNGKYKQVYNMKVLDNCKIELTLVENDDPEKSNTTKIGDKTIINILGVDKKNPAKYYTSLEVLDTKIYKILLKTK